jgi:hypothetical protein
VAVASKDEGRFEDVKAFVGRPSVVIVAHREVPWLGIVAVRLWPCQRWKFNLYAVVALPGDASTTVEKFR